MNQPQPIPHHLKEAAQPPDKPPSDQAPTRGGDHLQAYTVEQVAELLHVGRDKVYYLLRTGQLRSIKIGKLTATKVTAMPDGGGGARGGDIDAPPSLPGRAGRRSPTVSQPVVRPAVIGRPATLWSEAIADRLTEPGKAGVRRVLVVPGLWAPLHHVPAVKALAAFVTAVQPDGVVFLSTPGGMPGPAWEAFTGVLAAFRTGYAGLIGVHADADHGEHDAAVLASLRVMVVGERAPVVPDWLAVSGDLATTEPDVLASAQSTGANVVCGATGRLRLTGRARPAKDGTVRAWLVFECGTLAADPAAGTLGFGVLDVAGRKVTARPVRVGADGGFTFGGIRYTTPAGAGSAGGGAGSSSVNSISTVAPVSPAM